MQQAARGDRRAIHRYLKGERVGPPKFFRSPDGVITADPNEMLEMLSSYMETIYNWHSERNPEQLQLDFYMKYQETIDNMACFAEVPAIDHMDLFKAIQSKSDVRAAGLDGWQVRELHQLPACGWIPFAFVMRLAEATGKWPQSMKLISVASISKGVDMSEPKNVRCIGVASVVYSLWSSLRYKHLTNWQASVFPPSLIGGLSGRSAEESEWQLSLDLHDAASEKLTIFLDRFKCFDLVIPQVGLGIALRLGMPPHVHRAALGFYSDQVKFFKLGTAFGPRVLCSNSAVQGCSLCMLLVNSMYAVFAKFLEDSCPATSFRSFVDDAKIWSSVGNERELKRALLEAEHFDNAIGQVINDDKTTVLAKRKAKADRFLREIGRKYQTKRHARSLGFSQAFSGSKCPRLQNKKARKACEALNKIAKLPISVKQKELHVHMNAHSKWIYGSEIQAPSARNMRSLRSAVVKCIVSKKNPVRSPLLTLLTRSDPFLDPFGKWALHTFSRLRKMSRKNRDLVVQVLQKAKLVQHTALHTSNGIASVVAYLCKELEWDIHDPEYLELRMPDGSSFYMESGSNQFFQEQIGFAVRRHLLSKVTDRHECPSKSENLNVDIFLTRFLADGAFQKDEDFRFLRPYLDRLPADFSHTRAIIDILLTGAVYTGPRLAAAGIVPSDSCPNCNVRETHQHMFLECPCYSTSRPIRGSESLLSWATGIMFLPTDVHQFVESTLSFPEIESTVQPSTPVFVDGSAFHEKWQQLRTSAAAVVIPGYSERAALLLGDDHTSQRAELYAVVLALKMTHGPVCIASDCANVVNRASSLKGSGYRVQDIASFDNYDLWHCFLEEVHKRDGASVNIIKVAAHRSLNDTTQAPFLTEGNARADKLAKDLAKEAFHRKLVEVRPYILRACDLQTHLVATLQLRKQLFMNSYSYDSVPSSWAHSTGHTVSITCACQPKFRIKSKTSQSCYGICRAHRVGDAEDKFCKAVIQGSPLDGSVSAKVWGIHPSFKASLMCIGTKSPSLIPQPVPSFKISGCCVSDAVIGSLTEFVCQDRWRWGSTSTVDRCTWVAMMLEYLYTFGFQGSFLSRTMSVGVLARRFRDGFLHVLKHHGTACPTVSGLRHLRSFGIGFKSLSGLAVSRDFVHKDRILVTCLKIAEQTSHLNLAKRAKPSAVIIPNWDQTMF